MNPHKIIRVDWVDSAASHGWRDNDDNGLEEIVSLGYFVRQTKDFLVLTSSWGENGRCICPLAIPISCVKRKTFLQLTATKLKRKVKRMSFKSVQKSIARKEHVPMKNAGAILAKASRNASPAAKRANPSLRKVR